MIRRRSPRAMSSRRMAQIACGRAACTPASAMATRTAGPVAASRASLISLGCNGMTALYSCRPALTRAAGSRKMGAGLLAVPKQRPQRTDAVVALAAGHGVRGGQDVVAGDFSQVLVAVRPVDEHGLDL